MTKKINALVDEAMSQAQVFASAWSLVGGPFDFGDGLENAEVEKKALRALIADLLSASIADTAGAKPVHAQIEEIKTLMLEWINVKAGAPARAKWSEIDARLNALAAAPSITAMTDEQIVALADTHAFDTDKRIVQFARALLATPASSVADAEKQHG